MRQAAKLGCVSSSEERAVASPPLRVSPSRRAAQVHFGRYCGRVVAVKRSQLNIHECALDEFYREARILAGLHHPFITTFYGVSFFEDSLLLVTEYVPRSLEGVVKSFRETASLNPAPRPEGLSHRDALRLGVELAQTLVYLHKWRVVHMDIKPPNVSVCWKTRQRFTLRPGITKASGCCVIAGAAVR